MTTVELSACLQREVDSIPKDDADLLKRAIASIRRLKANAARRATRLVGAEADEDVYREPTKEEILAGLREGLQDLKARREGKDVGHKFRDLSELLNEV